MKKEITIKDKTITVLFHRYTIGIISNQDLVDLVKLLPEAAVEELTAAIKREFQAQYHKDFTVSDDSMIVEIWGHIFAEQFAAAVKSLTSIKLINNLAEKISYRCEVINIGGKKHDNNRFVWDGLAAFKPAIRALLF